MQMIRDELQAMLPTNVKVQVLSLKAGSVIAELEITGENSADALAKLIQRQPTSIAGTPVLNLKAKVCWSTYTVTCN